MTEPCLNPDCEHEVSTVGVCVECANSPYDPSTQGLDLGDGLILKGSSNVDGVKTKRKRQ